MRRIATATALIVNVALVAGRLNSQATVPNGEKTTAAQVHAEFEFRARANIDTLLTAWAEAIGKGSAKKLLPCYGSDAVVVLSTGARLQGDKAIIAGYKRLMPRMQNPRLNVTKVIANKGVARVEADLSYDVPLPQGGAYVHTTQIRFGLQTVKGDAYEITIQEGGDLPQLALAAQPPATLPSGASDSIRVRVTDATGDGVAGVMISFTVHGGAGGALSAPYALTDAKGIAAVRFTAGQAAAEDSIIALAAMLPKEPLAIAIRTGAPKP